MLTSEHTAREIERKARKVMGMLKRGIKFTPTQPGAMAILKKGRSTDSSLDWFYFGSKNLDWHKLRMFFEEYG